MSVDEIVVRDEGLTVLSKYSGGPALVADIVFIHGIQGHPERTWTCKKKLIPKSKLKNKDAKSNLVGETLGVLKNSQTDEVTDNGPKEIRDVYWPRDLLSRDFPNVRVLTYGYDSHVSKFFAATNQSGIHGHGEKFLRALKRERQEESTRPLIFLAHSLGGIITKEALRQAKESKDKTENEILFSTHAIIFFGTPHRGSPYADIGQVVERAASILFSTNSKLIRSLGQNGEVLERVRLDFLRILDDHKFKIYSFQEGKGLSGFKFLSKKVVENISSSLDHPYETREEINANHLMMCRYHGGTDEGYVQVKGVILEYLKEIAQVIEQSYVAILEDCRRSLYIPTINQRLNDIGDAESYTFEWIFSDHCNRFTEWLNGDGSLFWVKGKPASGKSTLMKYLYEHEKTRNILESRWVDNLAMSSFFFYDQANDPHWRSFNGLLRSILYDILTAIPQLFVYVKDVYQATLCIGSSGWNPKALERAVTLIATQQKVSGCFCLFMDALDEYPGDRKDIIRKMRGLFEKFSGGALKFKICASSRPLNEIEVMLGQVPGLAQITLHEWTAADIEIIVSNRLEEANQGDLKDLREAIVSQAKGSFIWVNLVLKSLSPALFHFQSEDELLEQLYSLPEDLNPFYNHLIQSIPKVIRPKIRIILQLMFCNANRTATLNLGELGIAAFLTEIHGELLLQSALSPSSDLKRCRELMLSIETCLGAFVELEAPRESWFNKGPPEWTFEPLTPAEYSFITSSLRFSHKTARDFIFDRIERDFFQPDVAMDNVLIGHMHLCNLYTQLAKAKHGMHFLVQRVGLDYREKQFDIFDTDLISHWAIHAREVEYIQYMALTSRGPYSHDVRNSDVQIDLSYNKCHDLQYQRVFEDSHASPMLDSTGTALMDGFNDALSISVGPNWIINWAERDYSSESLLPPDSFLSFAILHGLFLHSQDLLESDPSYPICQPLLIWAIASLGRVESSGLYGLWRDEAERFHKFAHYLLRRRVDPNAVFNMPFEQTLPKVIRHPEQPLRQGQADITPLIYAVGVAIERTGEVDEEYSLAALELLCILVENGAVVGGKLFKNYWVRREEAEERSVLHYLTYPVVEMMTHHFFGISHTLDPFWRPSVGGSLLRRTIKTLLDYGADSNAVDSDGKDVFSCMMAVCPYDILEYALLKGALISPALLEPDGSPTRKHGILWEARWQRPECYTPEAREVVRKHMPHWEEEPE